MKYHEHIAPAIKTVKSWNQSDQHNAVYGVVLDDGEVKKPVHNQCFGATREERNLGAKFIVSRIQQKGAMHNDEHHADVIKYYDWLFNVSPYSSVFITKSGEEAVKSKWMVINCEVPSNLMMSALQASRIPWEYHSTMWVLNDLTEAGVEPNLAFLIGMHMRGGEFRKGSADWSAGESEHRCLDVGKLDEKAIKAFINSAPVNCNDLYSKETEYAIPHRVNSLWGSGGAGTLKGYILNNYNVDDLLSDAVKSDVDLNPFRKKEVVKAGMHDYADSVKAMAIFSKNISKEFNLD